MVTFGSYHVPGQSDEYFFHQVKKGLGMFNKFYERCMLIGEFSAEDSEPCLSQLLFEMEEKILSRNLSVIKFK